MSVEKAIWSAYKENPCRLFSIRELSVHLGKSYPLIHQHTTRLLQDKIFLSKTVGKSILCYPNYQHHYALLALAQADNDYAQEQSKCNDELLVLRHFFSQQIFVGVVSIWSTNDELVIVLAHEEFKKSVQDVLSKTTFNQKITFLTLNDKEKLVDSLVNKSFVLFGFEQYHILIRNNYASFASRFNLVNLDE